MMSRRSHLLLLLLLMAAAMLSAGCVGHQRAVLYADTRTIEETGFTLRSPQYAYHGEPVTFDFAPDYGATQYAIFFWPDGSAQYLGQNDIVNTYFRAVRSFEGAEKPREYRITARGYRQIGRSDWFFDREKNAWEYFPMSRDGRDRETGKASMVIRCYVINLDLPLETGGRTISQVELSLVRHDGQRTTHTDKAADVRLIGPDQRGNYRLQYTPKWNELNRVGQTNLEILTHYTDGTQELKTQKLSTP